MQVSHVSTVGNPLVICNPFGLRLYLGVVRVYFEG